MNTKSRPIILALGFSATVAAAITGVTLRAETREAPPVAEACTQAAWPMIPAGCLEGGKKVRYIPMEAPVIDENLALRFADAFGSA